jgi:pSer/pThr/pTyr-binding forkhead associated (FHA) protein
MDLVVEGTSVGSAPADQDTEAWTFAPGAAMLIITRGSGLTGPLQVPLVAERTIVGRDSDCDVVLADLTISRRHAELRRTGDGFTVTDLGSLNGTYVNRNPVRRARLLDGDTVWIGRFRLVFRSGAVEPGTDR